MRAGGLDDLVACDEAEFIEKTTHILRHPHLRKGICDRMAAAHSALCNDVRSVRSLEDWIETRAQTRT